MNINFHHQNGRESFHKDTRVMRIVEILLSDERFFKDVAIILTNSLTFDQFTNQYENISKIWYRKIGNEYASNPIQGKISHDTFEELFNALTAVYNDDQDETKNLRGAIVEVYVHGCLNRNYHDEDIINLECKVQIGDWISSRTVDVGAIKLDMSDGECYECKLGLGAIELGNMDKQVKNLIEIHLKSNNIIISKIASFSYKEKVINLLSEKSIEFPESEVYGINELSSCPFQ